MITTNKKELKFLFNNKNFKSVAEVLGTSQDKLEVLV
jgi:hypothetical protein